MELHRIINKAVFWAFSLLGLLLVGAAAIISKRFIPSEDIASIFLSISQPLLWIFVGMAYKMINGNEKSQLANKRNQLTGKEMKGVILSNAVAFMLVTFFVYFSGCGRPEVNRDIYLAFGCIVFSFTMSSYISLEYLISGFSPRTMCAKACKFFCNFDNSRLKESVCMVIKMLGNVVFIYFFFVAFSPETNICICLIALFIVAVLDFIYVKFIIKPTKTSQKT